MTEAWRRRRACSCGVRACVTSGKDEGWEGALADESKWRLSIAGKDVFVDVWLVGADTVAW